MSQQQRAATIEQFGKKNKEPVILLISLKAGGVGLNLTMANRELLVHVCGRDLTNVTRRIHDGYLVERSYRTTSYRPCTSSRSEQARIRYEVYHQGDCRKANHEDP